MRSATDLPGVLSLAIVARLTEIGIASGAAGAIAAAAQPRWPGLLKGEGPMVLVARATDEGGWEVEFHHGDAVPARGTAVVDCGAIAGSVLLRQRDDLAAAFDAPPLRPGRRRHGGRRFGAEGVAPRAA